MKNKGKEFRLSLTQRQAMTGRMFVLPFYIGFFIFFISQVVQSITFCFNDVMFDPVNGLNTTWVGTENFHYIFNIDSNYKTILIGSLTGLAWKVPVIVVASLFIAIILKSKFVGRTFVRAVCFLPVVLAGGIIMSIVQGDTVSASVMGGNMVSSGAVVDTDALQDFLVNLGLGSEITNFINTIYENIFGVLWSSGVQIIIFLAALQSIPTSLYEASAIEGATAWEDFWKITIPMIGPMIMLNVFYTIIDSGLSTSNGIMAKVLTEYHKLNLDLSAAMGWTYFAVIAVVLMVVAFAFRKVNVKS